MDTETLAAYDNHATAYCDEWLAQPPAEDLQALWRAFLVPGAPTVDVGSGSGRDADWLSREGYPCDGIDASTGLIAEAGRRFPELRFHVSSLPDLAGIPDQAYTNVVCETVIMHLPGAEVPRAVQSLCRILALDGLLYLSWRVGDRESRDASGRLYNAVPATEVRAMLSGLAILYDREETSVSSGRRVHRLVARKPG